MHGPQRFTSIRCAEPGPAEAPWSYASRAEQVRARRLELEHVYLPYISHSSRIHLAHISTRAGAGAPSRAGARQACTPRGAHRAARRDVDGGALGGS